MIREQIANIFEKSEYNCAEHLLNGANKAYNLNVQEEAYNLVGGFGGGMGCENACGALCGGVAVIGAMLIKSGNARNTPGLRETCADFTTKFEKEFGSTLCAPIKAVHRSPETGCKSVMLKTADILNEVLKSKVK